MVEKDITMIRATAHMHDNSEEIVASICVWTVVCGVSQLQVEWEYHPVHQLPHPESKLKYSFICQVVHPFHSEG